jgi:hypothetical protein
MSNYTLDDDVVRVGTADLIAAGEPEMAEALGGQRFEQVLLYVGTAGDVRRDGDHRALLRLLEDSDYTESTVAEDEEWRVYTLSPARAG